MGGETARAKLTSVRKEVESVFDDMAEHNRVQIHAINLCEGRERENLGWRSGFIDKPEGHSKRVCRIATDRRAS